MATQKIKQAIIESLDDVKSNVIYVDKLPDTGIDGQMAVIEASNQYWIFTVDKWLQIQPSIFAMTRTADDV